LARGLNNSILFMLGMVFLLPAGFGLLIWRSYRSESSRAARGEPVATPGAIRWTPEKKPRRWKWPRRSE
jgi:hypothetical protein